MDLAASTLSTALMVQRASGCTFDQAWDTVREQGLVPPEFEAGRSFIRWHYEHPKIPTEPYLAGEAGSVTF